MNHLIFKPLSNYINRFLMLLIIVISTMMLPSTLMSQKTWVGINGDWDIGANWSGGTVPSSSDSVVIVGFIDVTIPSGYSARAKSLYIGTKIDLDIEERGKLNFKEGSRGINNLGTITCSGTINVRKPLSEAIVNDTFATIAITFSGVVNIDTSGTDAIVNYGVFTNNGLITVDSSAENGFTNNSTATLINHGIIELTDLSVFGLYNFGFFNNDTQGSLSISNTGSNGLYNVSNGLYNSLNDTIQNNGHILVVNSGGHGLHNSGALTNTNSIIIDSAKDDGISNGGVFSNEVLGSISISNVGDGGISNATGDTIQNHGSISIINVENHGLSNGGAFINTNSIVVDSIDEEGVYNFGTFINEPQSNLSVSNTGLAGMFNGSDDVFQNHGQIYIISSDEAGILNQGVFINTDAIVIDAVMKDGFQNSRILTNEAQGSISITNAGRYGIYIDNALDSIENNGQITISKVEEHGLYILGTLTNTSSIVIDSVGKNGIYNFKTFTNEIDGIISVVNAEVGGMYSYTNSIGHNNGLINISISENGIVNLGSFTNTKTIVIDTIGSHGFGNSGTFNNETQGSLSISNAGINGMYNNPVDTIQNNGLISIANSENGIINNGIISNTNSITIDAANLHGFFLRGSSVYTNDSGSLLHILNTTESPLEVDAGAVLTGLGEIIIED